MEADQAQANAFPTVTIYTGNDCFWCDRAKQYLNQRGVPYEELNVEENEALGPDVINLTGQRHVPVIVIGSHAIVGFRKPELDAELDAILASHREVSNLMEDTKTKTSPSTYIDNSIIDPRF